MYILFLLSLPPLPSPHPSRSSQSTRLGSLCYTVACHQLTISHMVVYIYVNATLSIHCTFSCPRTILILLPSSIPLAQIL